MHKRRIGKAVLFLVIVCAGLLVGGMYTRSQPLPQRSLLTGLLLDVPTMPTPVRAMDKSYLIYELHITNLRTNSLELNRIDIFADPIAATPLVRYDSAYLEQWISHPGLSNDLPDQRRIGGGRRAVLFLTVPIDSGAVPARLRHRLFFKEEKGEDIMEEGALVTVRHDSPLVISAPLHGDKWVALNSLGNHSHHRMWWIPYQGKVILPQRYAVDWFQLGPHERPFHDDPRENKNYYSYGAEVLAVANATVLETRDGRPDNSPFVVDKNAVQPEDGPGNYVLLDLGKGHFAVYAHLQPGSIRVKAGQRVHLGQTLGKLGCSGSADFPHLHFHIQDAKTPILADGLPYVLSSFVVQGKAQSLDALMEGKGFAKIPVAKTNKRTREFPLDNQIVRFAEP